MLMKLPKGVSAISIGDEGQAEEVSPGVVEIPFEHVEQAKLHGLIPHTDLIGDEDHTGKTKKELIAILEEKGVGIPANASKAVLLELISDLKEDE